MARASAHEIFTNVQATARREMERSTLGLAFSGLAGGLEISFGFLGVAVGLALAPPGWGELVAGALYPLGFILVIMSRAQLFTENTLTPVILVLDRPSRETALHTLRIWGVVLAANLLGAFIISLALAHFQIGTRIDPAVLLASATHSSAGSWGSLFLRGIFGAWLVALLVWMLHADVSPLGELVLIWTTTSMIYLAGFSHSVAGAVEGLYLADRHVITYVYWLLEVQAPVTLGNAVGGIVFVALLNYAQVVGAGHDVEVAEAREKIEEVHEAEKEEVARRKARERVEQGNGPDRT